MRKLTYLLILAGLGLAAWGGIEIWHHRQAAAARQRRVRLELVEWHRQIAAELPPEQQKEWEAAAADHPDQLLRACTRSKESAHE